MKAGGMLLAMLLATAAAAEEQVLHSGPFELRAARAEAHWRIRVLAAGRVVQVIEVESDAMHGAPWLGDADGDGAPDLWVPVMSGNANTEYEIWRQDRKEARFREAGMVSGHAFRRDGPYLVAIGRNGCCGAAYEAFRATAEGRLGLAFTIEARFRDDGAVEACGAIAEAEAPPAAVVARWCARGADGPIPGRRP